MPCWASKRLCARMSSGAAGCSANPARRSSSAKPSSESERRVKNGPRAGLRLSGKHKASGGGSAPAAVGTPGRPVPPPSTEFKEFTGGNVFRASVPQNWTNLASQSAVMSVPENGYGPLNGQTVFTHGVEFGVARTSSRNLSDATRAFLRSLAQSNPEMRVVGDQQNVRLSGQPALWTSLSNPSALGGQERITITTTLLASGNLFYFLTITPEKESSAFDTTFERIFDSIKLAGAR